jgi:hypothetical protein
MRTGNRAKIAFFEETDVGCQEKKSIGKHLNKDDLEQIAKEKYTVGLIKTFIVLDDRISIKEFWETLEPKLKYIKLKSSWLSGPTFKWTGKLTISFNKQYYIDLCKYYLNATIDDTYIYFPKNVVKENRLLEQVEFKHATEKYFSMKCNMQFSDSLENPLFNNVMINHTMKVCLQYAKELKDALSKPMKIYHFTENDEYYTFTYGIICRIWNVEKVYDLSFKWANNATLVAKAFYRPDLADVIKEHQKTFKEMMEFCAERLSALISNILNSVSNYEAEFKKNKKTMKRLEHLSDGFHWYGTWEEQHTHNKALDDNHIIEHLISRSKEYLETLQKFNTQLNTEILNA